MSNNLFHILDIIISPFPLIVLSLGDRRCLWCCNHVSGIPGDGRCLFRSVAHGAYLRAGKPSPSESLQKELADELREKVSNLTSL